MTKDNLVPLELFGRRIGGYAHRNGQTYYGVRSELPQIGEAQVLEIDSDRFTAISRDGEVSTGTVAELILNGGKW